MPFPVAPYSNTPRGNLIGTDLNRKAYLIGFSIMFLIADLAEASPANLLKSKVVVVVLVVGVVRLIACLLKAAKVRD